MESWDAAFRLWLLLCVSSFAASLMAEDAVAAPPVSRLPPPAPPERANGSSFRPSIVVIVGVLTTVFSLTFLLLLYAKHCKRSGAGSLPNPTSSYPQSGRRNSGIDRSVIESLPVFRFASLRGKKEGLECAVCLNKFDAPEVLRLLPKCKHAFHVECVDTWLDAHSTCPLCRNRVDPEDILLVDDSHRLGEEPEEDPKQTKPDGWSRFASPVEFVLHRISGRHSSAGEKSSGSLPHLDRDRRPSDASMRRSVDGFSGGTLRKASLDHVRVGCLDRSQPKEAANPVDRKRFEHRIIVSDAEPAPRRWSDFRPSDLLYLRSEMIIASAGRYSVSSTRVPRPSSSLKQPPPPPPQQQQRQDVRLLVEEDSTLVGDADCRTAIGSRCMSEITGLSRFRREEEERAMHRWLGFDSKRTEPR